MSEAQLLATQVSLAAPPRVELEIVPFTLRCGARLLVSSRRGASLTAMQCHVRGGVSLDPPGREGTAWLTGALIDQGTRAHSEAEIAEILERAGGSFGGEPNGAGGQIATTDWTTLMDLTAEMVTTPVFPREMVARQKQRLLDRLLVEKDDPRVQGERLFRRLVYGSHWLGRPAQGSIASVRKLARADLVRFHSQHWMPSRALLAVCGDVDPEEVRRRCERAFGAWKKRADRPLPNGEFLPRSVRVDAFKSDRAQVHLYAGHLGVRRNHPDYPALVVMDHVLGTGPGFTNRISRRLRDELGLAYTVHASIHHNAGLHPGTFTAYIGTSPQHVETALAGFVREIRRIQDEPVGDDELAVAKDYVVGSFALSFQRAARRAGYMISQDRHGLPADNLERMPRLLAGVTAADVQRVARENLFPDRLCVAAAGPLAKRELEAVVSRVLGTQPGA